MTLLLPHSHTSSRTTFTVPTVCSLVHICTLTARLLVRNNGEICLDDAHNTLFCCSISRFVPVYASAKDLPRLLRNKGNSNWEKYPVQELRGATLGVVGYGDIGKAAARLAHAYGMQIQALKRRPPPADEKDKDPIASVVYGNSKAELQKLFASCDYVLCAMPLTPETTGMIGKDEFDAAKDGAVFINVGRGPIVDGTAMIDALKDGRLKGVGLDVFATEPLPKDSPLWKMDNVLLSPHSKFLFPAKRQHNPIPHTLCLSS